MHETEETIFCILLLFICLAAVGALSYQLGRKTAGERTRCCAFLRQLQPFYATVVDVQDNVLTVKGMEINEIRYRGNVTIPVSDEGLKVGDTIAVHFTGENLEIHRQRVKTDP